jgi:hypothetical protein
VPSLRLLSIAVVALFAACAPLTPAPPAAGTPVAVTPHPALAPLAHWAGQRYVGTFQAGGRTITLSRTYAWSFGGRVLVGRSFGERDGAPVQSRETVFYWNPESRRIEFIDFIDSGGYGLGWLEPRDGQIYMDVKIVGNPGHPAWRAWVRDDGDEQVIRVEALRDGAWGDFGRFAYRRQP